MQMQNLHHIKAGALALGGLMLGAFGAFGPAAHARPAATPIRHLVVIFQENVSFDHYFATYPHAANPPGEPRFTAAPGTPSVNGLTRYLLTHNPNSANPFRLDRSQAMTCDMDHAYAAEQRAADAGLMDRFVESTGATYDGCNPSQVMGYYDGNTVTALWNYAQRFAMSDNSFGTTFGPSTVGALNLVAGQTHGATPANLPNKVANGTVIGDLNPTYDDCSPTNKPTLAMRGTNVGNLLNAAHVTWGWFQGGFRPTARIDGKAVCGATSINIADRTVLDYSPHHEPFQYYASTANPHHLPPTSVAMIGRTDQAKHQYDLRDFWAAARAGDLPAVSFLKAKKYQDGHAGYSDPLDEQTFLVQTLNRLQRLPQWKHTAVVISYDDSDGWYDHVLAPIVNQSNDPNYDALTGPGTCGKTATGAYPDRCGYGPRLPLLVISPWARKNFVDHSITDQSSILRFIEDNWHLGRIGDQSFDAKAGSLRNLFDFRGGAHMGRLFLRPSTGTRVGRDRGGDDVSMSD
ncbi:non-hemolytic phospholipase C precursor [bacterium BMS3Abin12]|nr:non-hemolytic phospholipase C precursor [bacterium BMS3Abin12]